jgi:PAT family beta-lactamase induction signal transducer AmpG
MVTGLVMGEPARHVAVSAHRGLRQAWVAVSGPLLEFMRRRGAFLVLLFVLLHKIGDTLANLTVRLLLNDLGFSNEEIATFDVGVGFFAYLIGIFIGGVMYASLGMKRSVLIALVLMAASNLSFAWLAGSFSTSARSPGRSAASCELMIISHCLFDRKTPVCAARAM